MAFIKNLLVRCARFFKGIGAYALRHKVQAGAAVLIIAGLGYWGYHSYKASITTTQYVLAAVRTAPIEATVTGSGQVASEHQLNLSPKASGTITSVRVKSGDTVVAGEVIATIDNTDAQKTLRDAEANFESARISYQQSLASNSNSLQKSHDAVFSSSASAYSDMGTVLNGIHTIMQGNEVSGSYASPNVAAYSKLFNDNPSITAYRDRLVADYAAAQTLYESSVSDYNATSRTADNATTEQVALKTYEASVATAQAAKDLNDYLNAVNMRFVPGDSSKPSILASHQTSSLSYVTTMNADVSSVQSSRDDFSAAIASSASGGSQTLTQEATQLSYQKALNSYNDAKETLADYVVVAPFPGTIANVALQVYDQAGSGTSIATLVTKEQYATLSLNEVDASAVKVGQPATLTFDALSDLTLNGTVAEVDRVGAVSQGVVSYTVKIGFDSQDDRILPGMTVNASIVTASNPSALVVPSSAIKTSGSQSYVEVATYPNAPSATSTRQGGTFRNASGTDASSTTRRMAGSSTGATLRAGPTVDASAVTLERVTVTTGIVGDTTTEITSGLSAGEFVVSSSLNASGKTTAASPSAFSLLGGGARAGTGAARTTTATGAARAGGNATFSARPAGGG